MSTKFITKFDSSCCLPSNQSCPPPMIRLFIGNISPITTESTLVSHFAKFGSVVHPLLKRGKTHSFAFITVVNQQVADTILKTRHVIDDYKVGPPELARSNISVNAQGKIFVGGIASSTDEIRLRSHFSRFGNVSSALP